MTLEHCERKAKTAINPPIMMAKWKREKQQREET